MGRGSLGVAASSRILTGVLGIQLWTALSYAALDVIGPCSNQPLTTYAALEVISPYKPNLSLTPRCLERLGVQPGSTCWGGGSGPLCGRGAWLCPWGGEGPARRVVGQRVRGQILSTNP